MEFLGYLHMANKSIFIIIFSKYHRFQQLIWASKRLKKASKNPLGIVKTLISRKLVNRQDVLKKVWLIHTF